MPPNNSEKKEGGLLSNNCKMDEEIVISGCSGRFPEANNIEELKKNLFAGEDMVTSNDKRWQKGLYGLPSRLGVLKDLSSFDAMFFGVHAKQAHKMDPQLRMFLELTYEAIIDAGINPTELRGSRTGVFIGTSDSEFNDCLISDIDKINGYELIGCLRAMFANRISYAFNFTGPSFALDTGCSSSLYALNQAILALKSGQCDSAIVGGSTIILNPNIALEFHRLSMLSPDGKCKAFDADSSGFVRSEGAVVILLQKTSNAKRIYATIVHSKVNTDGYKDLGITYPSGQMQYNLMKEIYNECQLDPREISYVEAHGTGTRIGDPQEVNALTKIFCQNRSTPLLIGSIKSNIGHTEAASGLCSIVKVIIAMECGVLPGNLHFKIPNPNIPALNDGRIKVVDRNTPWNGNYAAINSLGFGGTNAHVVLRRHCSYEKNTMENDLNIPKLITISGRTLESCQLFLDKSDEHQNNPEFISLIHQIHKLNINGHDFRGYKMYGESSAIQEIDQYQSNQTKRPIWFVFSGIGSQWPGMAKQLLKIKVFEESINCSAQVLRSHGINLFDLIFNGDNKTFDDLVNTLACITSIQLAIIDLLKSIGIEADGMLGHSLGELGCAYADGTLTCEQALLLSYWRGKCVVDADITGGAMAAIGTTWEDAKKLCPAGVYPACHNSKDSVTVSGPAETVKEFVKDLKSKGIFAKLVESSGGAFHSIYVEKAGESLERITKKIIPVAKARSSKWISTSVDESKLNTTLGKFSSAEYHTNNLISPVLFWDALKKIPDNAIAIEIAPHCILHAILRRALPQTVMNIGIQRKGLPDNLEYFLTNIGKLYNAGIQSDLSKLYPPVSLPVSPSTPMLNSFIEWDHSAKWTSVDDFHNKKSKDFGKTMIEIDLSKNEYAYLSGHNVDGKILYPGTGYLTLLWQTFAKLNCKNFQQLPIVMKNIIFHRSTIIPKNGKVTFSINIFNGTNAFEICEGESLVVTGQIYTTENIEKTQVKLPVPEQSKEINDETILNLNRNDVYKELKLRGYEYSGVFQGIKSSDNFGMIGEIDWNDEWMVFMDSMLQFSVLEKDRILRVPTRLQYLSIDPIKHLSLIENKTFKVYLYSDFNIIKSGGIEFRGLNPISIPRRSQTNSQLRYEKYLFVPYESKDSLKVKYDVFTIYLQIIMENIGSVKIKGLEISNNREAESLLSFNLINAILNQPNLTYDLQVITTSPELYKTFAEKFGIKIVDKDHSRLSSSAMHQDLHLIMAANVFNDSNKSLLFTYFKNSIKSPGYLLLEEESVAVDTSIVEDNGFVLVAKQTALNKTYLLLVKKEERKVDPLIIQVFQEDYSWLKQLKVALKKSQSDGTKILLVVKDPLVGIVGMMNCLRREPGGSNVSYIFIQDENALEFSLKTWFYSSQLDKQLIANVLKGNQWGSYRHLSCNQIKIDVNDETILKPVEHAYVGILVKGDLSSLKWIEGPPKYSNKLNSFNDICNIYYASLNFRDIMIATGKLSVDSLPCKLGKQDSVLGFEFSGVDSKQQRVMGMVAAKGLATSVLTDSEFIWQVPKTWSLKEAATVPVCYSTGYYALLIRGKLKPGESILIHAGAGGVGLASINIAFSIGCKVFTTVGTDEKREFLKKLYPQLTDRNIGNSRDTNFEQLILKETNGRGVNVVLNSLSEDKLLASVRCLARNGRFLEIGKNDFINDNPLGMGVFIKNISFHGVFLDILFDDNNVSEKIEIVKLVSNGIAKGIVKPLPTTVFNRHEIEDGFRYMAQGKHIGKVLIKIRDEEISPNCIKKSIENIKIPAIPKTYMNPSKCYIIIGGLGGLGLELADWMITRGAKYIILTSRSGIKTGYQSLCVRRWKEMGITVIISTENIMSIDATKRLIENANKIAPVGGIFNLAIVIYDDILENLNESHFENIKKLKFDGTRNLDLLSREMCPFIDHFVAFSSFACGRGNAGQTNYAMANSAMERIVEQRRALGLPGLAIQWGPIGDVGAFIEQLRLSNEDEVCGIIPQRIANFLHTIDIFLQQPDPVLASMILSEKLIQQKDDNEHSNNITDVIANVLGIKNMKNVNQFFTLTDLGMDSLMRTEIKQILERSYDIIMSSTEIGKLTFSNIAQLLQKPNPKPLENDDFDKI